MTREEEKQQASEIYLVENVTDRYRKYFGYMKLAFEAGAEWSDNHPINVWHNVSEEPLKGRICLAEFGASEYRFQTFVLVENNIEFNWNEWVKEICLLQWAYISDLLPKGD